jgi:flagellar basal body-associated protein FliL
LRSGVVADGTATVIEAAVPASTTGFPVEAATPFVESSRQATRATPIDRSESGDAGEPNESAAEASESEPTSERPSQVRRARTWYAVSAVLVLAIAAVAALALSFYNKASLAAQRASDAQQRAERIASAAAERIEAARQNAATQITQARDQASKAQVTADVLAASDLVRFNLAGGDSTVRMSAQLLWSRSRGMVFSASRLSPLRAGAVYQIWLVTAGDPVSAATVVPDPSGRVTFATDEPPNVPRPLIGVRVTVESAPGSQAPSGPTVLARLP